MGATENAELIRRCFETLRRDGLEAFLAMLPADVEWHLYSDRGRTIGGSESLRSYLTEAAARGVVLEAEMADVEPLDADNVLVTGTVRRRSHAGTTTDQVTWLYCFRDGRLWRASGHGTADEARQAARFMHTDRVALSRNGGHFHVTLHEEPGGRTVLEPAGELDIGTVPEFRAAVEQAARSGHVLVDLSRLTFMDSSGLRALLEAARDARDAGWRLELREASEAVQRVIAMTGADRLLPFEAV